MPATFDSALLRGLYSTQAMRAVFDDTSQVDYFLEVERALARVQGRAGMIPLAAADAIDQDAQLDRVDFAKYERDVAAVGYPIAPLVEQIVGMTRDGLGQYAHYGATTQDIMDTALALQLRDAFTLVGRDLDDVAAALAEQADRHRETLMVGRSQLQHALPVTFGYKAATWLSAVDYHRRQLPRIVQDTCLVQLGGAVGTLASLGDSGLGIRVQLADELELADSTITWHTTRERIANAISFLGVLTGTLAKIGTDLVLLAQTDVDEISEPSTAAGVSSTMPQKRNPIAPQVMITSAKIVRGQVDQMLEALVQDHERGTGTWALEWFAIPTAFLATSGSLTQASTTIRGLEPKPDNMLANLAATDGLIMAEAIQMALAPTVGRAQAHDLVHQATTGSEHTSFEEALTNNPEITEHLTAERIRELMDPSTYLGTSQAMITRVLDEHAHTNTQTRVQRRHNSPSG